MCEPSPRLEYGAGLVHAVKVPVSRRHSNVEPDSVAWNANEAVVALVTVAGPESMMVSGGVLSTVQV